MDIHSVQAIDVHAHYGLNVTKKSKLLDRLASGDGNTVVQRARVANTRLTVVSPLTALFPRLEGDAVAGNIEAREVVAQTPGLLQWVVVNPLAPKTYEQACSMLALPTCVGIKIHPEEHGYPIIKHGQKLFEFASDQTAVMITHSGEQNSMPADFVKFANDFPEVRLITSHLGCGWDDDPGHQVRAISQAKHGNVYVDTSSAKSITPGLVEWAVAEIGAERILYGTDSPLYFAPMQRARIDYAEIPDAAKQRILCQNAEELLEISKT